MKFEVNITEEDYLKFNYYHHFHSKSGKKLIFGMRIAVPILLLAIEVTDLLKGVDSAMFWYNVVFMTVFTVIWEIIVNPVMKHSIRFSIKNMKKDGKLPYHVNAQIEIKEDCIVESTENSMLTIPKGDILSVCDVEDYIYVYFGGQQAVIIPKRCIEGMEEQVKRALSL